VASKFIFTTHVVKIINGFYKIANHGRHRYANATFPFAAYLSQCGSDELIEAIF